MRLRTGLRYAFSGGCFILAVATALIAQKEGLLAVQAPTWRAEAIIEQTPERLSAYSIQADYAAIDACLRVAMSVESLLSPSVERINLADTCQTLAKNITETSPLNAYAWFAQAYFSQTLGQNNVINRALERSYLTGPNEQWIAQMRVSLAEKALPALSDAAISGHMHDLALLVQSRRGIAAIAQRYVRDPRFRARIADIVEGLPVADQRRFITGLEHEMRGR